MKISVLGAGGWGTTLSILLNSNGHNVTLWEFNPEYAKTLGSYRENFYYLPKIKIPQKIEITNDLVKAVSGRELIVIATPTQYIRDSFKQLSDFDFKDTIIVNVSKGIEIGTLKLVNEIITDVLKKVNPDKISCLSGPSHAEEVARKIPTVVVCANPDMEIAKTIQTAFSNDYFRVYTSTDIIGVELGGALKNVIAIAAGITDGARFGDNTKAALMTRGINEIMNLGLKLGAKRETFFGLSGIGDLIVTCSSKHSRNRFVGEEIGKGKKLKEVLADMKMVAEGISTAKSIHQLSEKLKIEMPICEQVYQILFNDKNPIEATNELMVRTLKEEN
ncbi:MAG TPA: NAD(P)H-dependent glycerol-3-phosphate dehydrogenase [Ignavibacteria bacterium]|nr:NAD(P)H-dependent glycerol-3-phosphate dehydrogenase [Ignavibacteria bacterium]